MISGDLFLGKANEFVSKSAKDVEKLQNMCDKIPPLTSNVAILFAENVESFDMDGFVELLRNFMKSFTQSMKALELTTEKPPVKERTTRTPVGEDLTTRRDSHRPIMMPGLLGKNNHFHQITFDC
jgi:hypothetical protein